ncbi:MAG: hypothetical protein H7840_16750 [Alphaproteobacteria bacterium]
MLGKIVLMVATVAMVSIGCVSGASAEGKQDFTLVNKTGYTIDQVYVSPSNASDWEDDVLGRDTLDNKETVHITFARSNKSCKWDLKVVYSDKETAEWDDFDLCSTSKITIFYDRKSGETTAEYE